MCSVALQSMDPLFWNPQVVTQDDGSEVVEGVVGLTTNGVGCGDSVTIVLQTKVCGFFGCNYQDVASATYTQLPMFGRVVFPALDAPVRAGTNRYRLEVDENKYVFDGDNGPGPGFAGFVHEGDSEFSDGVQLTP